MEKKITLIFCLINLLSFGQLFEWDSIHHNPGKLNFFYTLADTSKEQPVIIVLHGCQQSAKSLAEIANWNTIATKDSFHLLFPEQKKKNHRQYCFNWMNSEKAKHESESIMEYINAFSKKFAVDSNKIYLVGYSAGAMLATHLAVNFPSKFKGVVSYAGGPYLKQYPQNYGVKMLQGNWDFTEQELKENLPHPHQKLPQLIIFHGVKDQLVSIKNSEWLMKQWLSNCDTCRWDFHQNQLEKAKLITVKTWSDSNNSLTNLFFQMNGIGHQIAIGDKKSKNHPFTKEIGMDSTEKILELFQQNKVQFTK